MSSARHRVPAVLKPSKYPPTTTPGLGSARREIQDNSQTRLSARSTYPQFLPIWTTALLQLRWAWRGLIDAFRWDVVLRTIASDTEIRQNVYKSLILNSVSLLSIYVFDLLLQPIVREHQQHWFHRNMGWFYQVMWLLPVVGASLYLNGIWCTTIAKRTYLLQYGGRPVTSSSEPPTYTGLLRSIATSAYRFVMICTSVVVGFTFGRMPLIGSTLEFFFMCWVDAYYCFEFVWISRGYSLSRRIRYLEERWAYFFSFGLPATALCMWGSTLANVALFALFFPAYIIMAMHAHPCPIDPFNPLASSVTMSKEADHTIMYPSPFIPIHIPIFALVIWLNDAIIRVLNVIGRRPGVKQISSSPTTSMKGRYGYRPRAGSNADDSAEEGRENYPGIS